MKEELYCYSTSLKNNQLSNIPIACIWILLFIFLLPILLSNLWIGLTLLFLYLFFYLFSKKEKDEYNKELINLGLFMLFLGLEVSLLLLKQYNVIKSLTLTLFIFTVSYEILWFIKMKKKMYSQRKTKMRAWTDVLPLIFGSTGIWFGKLLAKNENIEFKTWIAILFISALVGNSISIFQKFIIHKILKE